MNKTARNTARPTQTALLVRLGETLYAIPIEFVEEVLPALPLEPVPQAPSFLRGVVFVRGHLIPVVSAGERLGLPNHARPVEPPIVCLTLREKLIGVEVDEALDLVELPRSALVEAAEFGARDGFFSGLLELDQHVVRLLNPEKLLATDEAEELHQTSAGTRSSPFSPRPASGRGAGSEG